MSGRKLLEEALRRHGIDDPVRLESHIRGCDLRRRVSEITLEMGAVFAMWVRDGGKPGKHASPDGEDPRKLGIMVEGRHLQTYRVRQKVKVVSSTAAFFPAGMVNDVGGEGGGTQYLLPPDWLESVERMS